MSEFVRKTIKSVLRAGVRFVRWGIRKMKESEVRPYRISLKVLIRLCEIRKKDREGVPICPYCDTEMMFRHSKIVTTVGPVRDDQVWKCTSCYHTAHFGIPMTRVKALDEIQLRGSPTLMRPSERPDEDGLKVVTERLRRLGYIE